MKKVDLTEIPALLSTFPQIHDGHSSSDNKYKSSYNRWYDIHQRSLIVSSVLWRIVP